MFAEEDGVQTVQTLAWVGQRRYLIGSRGSLRVMSVADGQLQDQSRLSTLPVWDALTVAGGRLFVSLTTARCAAWANGESPASRWAMGIIGHVVKSRLTGGRPVQIRCRLLRSSVRADPRMSTVRLQARQCDLPG